MEWGWIIGAFVIFALFGMWKTSRRNNDPIYHHLLAKLFAAAEVTDDISDDCFEIRDFLKEVRKMQELDGGLKAGQKLAHLATMIPYYGNATPMIQSRAKLIIDRIVRNGAKNFPPIKETPSSSAVQNSQAVSVSIQKLFDENLLKREIADLLQNIDAEVQEIFFKHMKFLVQDAFRSPLEDGFEGRPKALLVLMSREKPKKNQKKKPMIKVTDWSVGSDILYHMAEHFAEGSPNDVEELKRAASYCLRTEKQFGRFAKYETQAMLVSAILKQACIPVADDALFEGTPVCYSFFDKSSGTYTYFVSLSIKERISIAGGGYIRDFSHWL